MIQYIVIALAFLAASCGGPPLLIEAINTPSPFPSTSPLSLPGSVLVECTCPKPKKEKDCARKD